MSEPTGTVSQATSSPPIVEIARFVGQALQKSYGLASRIAITIVRSLIAPITLLYHPVSYLLAPVTVLAQVLLDLFVFTPYAIALSVVRNVYPLYVFVGAPRPDAAACRPRFPSPEAHILLRGRRGVLHRPSHSPILAVPSR